MDVSQSPPISEFLQHFNAEYPRARMPLMAFMQRVAADLRSGQTILDVGAGDAPYRELFAHANYLTSDWTGTYYVPNQPVDIVAPATHIPLEDASLDAVLNSQVLEHLAEPWAALAEFRRLLRPGGKLWLTAPFVWYLHEEPHDYYRYTSYGLRFLLEHAGFTNIEIMPLTDSFTTVAQLVSELGWMMGRRGDGHDGQREVIAATMKLMAEVIAAFAAFDTKSIFPLNFGVNAMRPVE